jgi:hypothetical protein
MNINQSVVTGRALKTHAVEMTLAMWPDRLHAEIAAHVGCSQSLVSKVSTKCTGKSGPQSLTGRALQSQIKREAVRALVGQGGLNAEQIAEQLGCSRRYVQDIKSKVATTSQLPSTVSPQDARRRGQVLLSGRGAVGACPSCSR